jgi:hypothetical protein
VRLTIIQLATFVADWERSKYTDDDLRALEGLLLEDPERGAVISGTGGLRKFRFAPPSRHTGKRGATRVGYAYFPTAESAVLVVIFSKNEKENLTPAERRDIKQLLERVRKAVQE